MKVHIFETRYLRVAFIQSQVLRSAYLLLHLKWILEIKSGVKELVRYFL